MASLFVKPLPLTVVSSLSTGTNPLSFALTDEPNLVWRSTTTTTYALVDAGTSASYDTIALVGTNLLASDTVTITCGTGQDGSGNITGSTYTSGAVSAWTGSLPSGSRAKAVFKLPATQTARYIKIAVTTAAPVGYLECQRIVIGRALAMTGLAGVDLGFEQTFIDTSVAYSGDGWSSFDQYPVLHQMKLTASFIADADWRSDWFGFFQSVGKFAAFLVVPDDTQPTNWQSEVIFGRLVSEAQTAQTTYGIRKTEMTIRSLAQ